MKSQSLGDGRANNTEKTMSPSAATSHHSNVDMKIIVVVINWFLIITCIESLTEAKVVQQCPSKKGLPSYWNDIERRCEVCSVSVCEISRPPPEACRCFCKNNLHSNEYSIHEGECADGIPKAEDKGQSSSEGSIPLWALFVIVSGIVLIFLVIVLKCVPKSKIKECLRKQSVSTITVNTSEGRIAPNASGNLQPITAPPTRLSQPENWPIQATGDDKITEETRAKTSSIGSCEEEIRRQSVPRQTVGPSYPSEGDPGGKYRLLPQNDPAEANA